MRLTNYIQQIQYIKKNFGDLKPIVNRCDRILETITALQHHHLPMQSMINLEIDDDFIFEHLIEYPQVMNISSQLENFRQTVVENFGIWHVCSQSWINDLYQFCGKNASNLELMAGNALISANLPHTIATDNLDWQGQDNENPQPWTQVERLDALDAVQKYFQQVDNIIMAWAPDDDVDWKILRFLRKVGFMGHFIVIGERNGATNSSVFWNNAHLELLPVLNLRHQPFDFIKDQVWIVS